MANLVSSVTQASYFSESEVACSCCGEVKADPEFLVLLNALRIILGRPLKVTSFYRCEKHPVEAKKKKPGSHFSGRACDVACTPNEAVEILSAALPLGLNAIGFGGDMGFLHLEKRPNVDVAGWYY